jgi:hypothetical protein
MSLDKNPTMLEFALEHAARGWYVFPCKPRDKYPITQNGWHDASIDPDVIKAWWTKTPQANVGIACGMSGLAVLDVDTGLAPGLSVLGLSDVTYSVRSGRRPHPGRHAYYRGPIPDVKGWEWEGCKGDVKSLGGYVLAAGSIHPSGEAYEVITGNPADLAPTPPLVRALKSPNTGTGKDAAPVEGGRNNYLTSVAGKLRNAGMGLEALEVALLQHNADVCVPPLDEEEVKAIAAHVAKYDVPEQMGEVTISAVPTPAAPTEPVDWRTLFHSKDAMVNAPPITFLIKDYLMREGVTAIAAPVRERKSLIAINIAHALLTGEKLFDHFEVVHKPTRVLYLCPEVSLGPFTDRIKKLGLIEYVGETFFCRTLSADGHLPLSEPSLLPALPGAVVILDTAIRFLEGDENSSQDVRKFADSIFALLRNGAESVVMLHHSPKDAGDTMTLENAMRGSGDMGAFLACCWGTRLQDPAHPYESASFLSNLKQRDFESKDFDVLCSPDCRMHIVGNPALTVSTLAPRRRGNVANKDGRDEAALALIKTHPKLSVRKAVDLLKENGIKRGKDWVQTKRYDLVQKNGGQMP